MNVLDLLEPITYENIHELHPGEWIWDNKEIAKHAHKRSLRTESIEEPFGFRQVHILDLDLFPTWSATPFMLTCAYSSCYSQSAKWEYFEHGRFYKFRDVITFKEDAE